MPIAKRRKVTTTASHVVSSAEAITAFVKVSKSTVDSKSINKKTVATDAFTNVESSHIIGSHKRKRTSSTEINIIAPAKSPSGVLSATITVSSRSIDPSPQRKVINSTELPKTPRNTSLHELSPAQTDNPIPINGAPPLDEFVHTSSTTKDTSPTPQAETSGSVDLNSPQTKIVAEDLSSTTTLPSELVDLVNLQSAFLTALSLYYAHNGAHSPADLRLLLPDIARAWGKRKVMLDDVRKTLGVLNSKAAVDDCHKRPSSGLCLSDYGHGKICVEIRTDRAIRGHMTRPLDEDCMNEIFTRNLQRLWKDYSCGEVLSTSYFIQNLSLEPVHICSSLSKMSPLLANGQRRLEDIKSAISRRKQTNSGKVNPSPGLTGNERPNLLDRLKAKQLQQSRLPAPSKAETTRKAALQRLEEVVSVLALLTTSTSIGQQRVSFTLPTVLGKLRDSFKTPISKDEGEACLRLLASEIAPDWLKLVKIGKVDAIVVDRKNRPRELDIQERVKGAA